MTVPAGQKPIITYAYAGVGDYDFSFRVFKSSDLVLTHLDGNGVRTLLVFGEFGDYTVTLLDDGDQGGTCHLTSAIAGGTLEIRRSLLQEQPTDWVNNNPFNAELLETDLDRAIMIIQEMQVIVDGSYVSSNWRADWLPNHPYYVRDMIVHSTTGNIYTALTDHLSSTDFDADLRGLSKQSGAHRFKFSDALLKSAGAKAAGQGDGNSTGLISQKVAGFQGQEERAILLLGHGL